MPSALHTKWSTAKKALDAETLKALGKNKLDLGKSLDEFEKVSTALDKEFATGSASKRGAAGIDALTKLRARIVKAGVEYTKVLKKAQDDLKRRNDNRAASSAANAVHILEAIEFDIDKLGRTQAKAYADLAQARKDITLGSFFGPEGVQAITRFKFVSSPAIAKFAQVATYSSSPTDPASPDRELASLQQEFARCMQSSAKAFTALKDTSRKFATEKDAHAYAKKAVYAFGDAYGVPNGAVTKVTEWMQAISQKARGTDYLDSTQGQLALAGAKAVGQVWQHDEPLLNILMVRVDKAFER